ncbi:hypothetical protein C8Q72DRAFT_771878 [Fomitopsis betulina]|nr:hypothetical protein C8Q72DRAFT_771878 [Fomitopsis betulina]
MVPSHSECFDSRFNVQAILHSFQSDRSGPQCSKFIITSCSSIRKVSHRNTCATAPKGDADESPIILEDTNVKLFLSVFYPEPFDSWELTETEQLVSVLRLARKWEFRSIVGLVARRMSEVASLVDQVSLTLKHNLPNVVGAKLCARSQPLTLSESRRLGVDAAYSIWTLRERLRGDEQTVSLSDVAHEEQQVRAYFEETGLIRTEVERVVIYTPPQSPW